MFARFEVCYQDPSLDSRSQAISKKFSMPLRLVEVFWVKSLSLSAQDLKQAAQEILLDPILHTPKLEGNFEGQVFERRLHPGMTDNRARTLKEALLLYFPDSTDLEILSGDLLVLNEGDPKGDFEKRLKANWVNPWIHELKVFSTGAIQAHARFAESEVKSYFKEISSVTPEVRHAEISKLSDAELKKFSETKLLALSLEEMKVIQDHFKGLGREPTDVEIEIIAQTWSEHCKHKIFGAEVSYEGVATPDGSSIPSQIKSLFKTTVAATTESAKKPWLLSVFKDNAGIVAFSKDDAVCLKVETHNSPSALDPFGGAITGIVGVNRDILGTGIGARPVFNTNVFCVGPTGYKGSLPDKMHHPQDLLEGVRLGVEDGGNQSGIPTVNGAVHFDESYMGKPLIFVGSGGWMPRVSHGRPIEEKKAFPQDLIFMVGGRIGKDGIHGATFSSLELTDQMPSSVVQLGDPITQKRMTDFLLRARDQNLIQALTDNGAGGLSSSVGEISGLTGGAKIDLAAAKTKYPGLAPWELVVSESQERMTVVVRKENQASFESLARLFEVEISLLGEMNTSGFFEVCFQGKTVAKLSLDFLHEQCPKLKLNATWNGTGLKRSFQLPRSNSTATKAREISETLKALLAEPNIASKEWIIRQYDHEVQGCSVVKPLQTSPMKEKAPRSSPNDAGVQRIRVDSDLGSVVSCGMNPELSLVDPYLMAQAAVDEAVRNALCAGAEFSTVSQDAVFSLVDNFCWPDPTQNSEIMGALVRTCFGMKHAALELKLPFISGKDSMKNDFRGSWDGKSVLISVLPTLLVTALARIKNVEHARTAEFKDATDVVYLIGPNQSGLMQTAWSKLPGNDGAKYNYPVPHWDLARRIYNWLGSSDSTILKSLHDLSDGGLLVALTECAFARSLGLKLEVEASKKNSDEFFFGEGFHRFVGSVAANRATEFESKLGAQGIPFLKLGVVTDTDALELRSEGRLLWSETLESLYDCWRNGVVR